MATSPTAGARGAPRLYPTLGPNGSRNPFWREGFERRGLAPGGAPVMLKVGSRGRSMAKAKWLDTNWWDADKATRPLTMAGRVGPSRRLRLVAAAYVRSVYPGVTPLRSLAKHADRIERAADEPLLPDKQTIPHWVNDLSRADADAKVVLSALRLVLHYATEHTALGRKDRKQVPANTRVMLAILRDVFGDQFSPPRPDPAWRTDTAVAIARQMYESRDFSAMPILADALQDAGCDDADVLSHCRDANQTHVRGCWVVDLVLGKE